MGAWGSKGDQGSERNGAGASDDPAATGGRGRQPAR